jgi:hypothetical protein
MISNDHLFWAGLPLALGLVLACSGPAASEDLDTTTDAIQLELHTAELTPVDDARIQAASGDVNFGSAQLWINTEASHYSLVKFGLAALPAAATIESARFVLRYTGNYVGERTVELGRVEDSWSEDTITWNNAPPITWGGPTAVVDGYVASDLEWDVTELVQAWQRGERDNEGFGLQRQGPRGAAGPQEPARPDEQADSTAPDLQFSFSTEPEQ